jgi:pimeloyl-ACP methyl ester carboxylesterase
VTDTIVQWIGARDPDVIRLLHRSSIIKELAMSIAKTLRTTLAALAIGVGAMTATAQTAQPVKNIVLVHGAFADGSSWAKVITILQAKGFNVTAVQNP